MRIALHTFEKMKQGPFKDMPPPIMENLLRLGRQPKDMSRLAHSMGVKIALGTDSGVSPRGKNANEFVEYVNVRTTEMEALMAGTVNAADIVAMMESPLDDIGAVLHVKFIMRDGVVFRRPD